MEIIKDELTTTGTDGFLYFGDTPNRVLSDLRITSRRLKMEPDLLYPDTMSWVTTDFDPLVDEHDDLFEDQS